MACRFKTLDTPLPHGDLAAAALGQSGIMGDEDKGHLPLFLFGKQEIGDLASGFLIEIAGWLICDQDRRLRGQRPSKGDTLLFAAR